MNDPVMVQVQELAGTILDECGNLSAGRAVREGRADAHPLVRGILRIADAASQRNAERCAKIAEGWCDEAFATEHENRSFRDIAAAIRQSVQTGGE